MQILVLLNLWEGDNLHPLNTKKLTLLSLWEGDNLLPLNEKKANDVNERK